MNNNYVSILNRIVTFASNSLTTINKIIPVYNNAKPILKKISEIKKLVNNSLFLKSIKNNNYLLAKDITKKDETIISSPQFFQ